MLSSAENTNSPCVLLTNSCGLRRRVYCILGIVVDAVDMATAIAQIQHAAKRRSPFFVSTPNLNFLVQSRMDHEFRETILDSDLCLADGMSVVWLAWLLGLPVTNKVSGSDLFETMKTGVQHLKVFFFGGPEGVAEAAKNALNAAAHSLTCVGSLYPGIGSVEDLSSQTTIDTINRSEADFLAVSLGANKGQSWLRKNHVRLTTPVRIHLGAVFGFQAGSIRRAPRAVQQCGFEWLWRIREERHLWPRYRDDGLTLLYVLLTRIVPLAALNRWSKIRSVFSARELIVRIEPEEESVLIRLVGAATEPNADMAALYFERTLASRYKTTMVDLSSTELIDSRFLALLLLFRKNLKSQGAQLAFVKVPRAIEKVFALNDLSFLLTAGR
jgi:N-acetylglucosaminyldiphosphoundecaprenol N-acetyl-beta-D-mannosaminyltransferase